eukprot:TRINITY_DN10449_c0_g1_i2.p1 TRINITY_DN10449_c0_g1~~TRINITY_DN10449_c0_g1_i2.p1  ORF type:complete len:512 (-),score=45.59 TRINITY_DN10449_c0_g1_i2:8-1543(-)
MTFQPLTPKLYTFSESCVAEPLRHGCATFRDTLVSASPGVHLARLLPAEYCRKLVAELQMISTKVAPGDPLAKPTGLPLPSYGFLPWLQEFTQRLSQGFLHPVYPNAALQLRTSFARRFERSSGVIGVHDCDSDVVVQLCLEDNGSSHSGFATDPVAARRAYGLVHPLAQALSTNPLPLSNKAFERAKPLKPGYAYIYSGTHLCAQNLVDSLWLYFCYDIVPNIPNAPLIPLPATTTTICSTDGVMGEAHLQLLELPQELIVVILSHCTAGALFSMAQVNRQLHAILRTDSSIWETVLMPLLPPKVTLQGSALVESQVVEECTVDVHDATAENEISQRAAVLLRLQNKYHTWRLIRGPETEACQRTAFRTPHDRFQYLNQLELDAWIPHVGHFLADHFYLSPSPTCPDPLLFPSAPYSSVRTHQYISALLGHVRACVDGPPRYHASRNPAASDGERPKRSIFALPYERAIGNIHKIVKLPNLKSTTFKPQVRPSVLSVAGKTNAKVATRQA